MREITFSEIRDTVAGLCVKANLELPQDIAAEISKSKERETKPLARSIMEDLLRNLEAAKRLNIPICQDTGMAVVFAELGQEVHVSGGLLTDAVNEGVRKGYVEGLLRCSVVKDPLDRVNTGDNTPAVLHLSLVSGDRLKLTVAPKGFGSENMSGLKMLNPSYTKNEIIREVVEIVKRAGGNPCPPMVIGVGLGGNFELCALLAKKALCRPLDRENSDPKYAGLEKEMLAAVNETGIGPQGFGGTTTALGLNIETAPTHIAGLPLAVNIGCHVTRHAQATL
ncbi:MAG TPA: fumarate hydratase [Ruminococcaceae bacterium]|nr:fumarate hydratase [Oscillospiraceae bacterium]